VRHRHPFKRIAVQEADDILERPDIAVLDVRDATSFREKHIDGAQHVSHANVSIWLGGLSKAIPVLIYCYHGQASQEYAQMFSDFGFTEVYSLDGGYQAWCSRPQTR
jgi:rhodanese-related sulfurtransferase